MSTTSIKPTAMMSATTDEQNALESLEQRVQALKWHGVLAHWQELTDNHIDSLHTLLQWEERERTQRGLQRRLRIARIGRFKPLADFDWNWPTQCDKDAVLALMSLEFIEQAANIVLVGPNGVGKSTIAQNLAHHAAIKGHSVLFTTAAQMLADLAEKDGDNALRRRLKYYAQPQLLVIDEVGYLSYGNRHADLLFEIVNRRYENKSTIVTTNRPFAEWGEVFPNASCVVSLVDRLVHHAEIIVLDGTSYRIKEAKERAEEKKATLKKASRKKSKSTDNTTTRRTSE